MFRYAILLNPAVLVGGSLALQVCEGNYPEITATGARQGLALLDTSTVVGQRNGGALDA